MTIHVKDQYQPQREMTVAEANLELQTGRISTAAMVWKPGMEHWVPILSLPEFNPPVPPPVGPSFNDTDRIMSKKSDVTASSTLSAARNVYPIISRVLAFAGLLVAYTFVFLTSFAAAARGGETNTATLVGILIAIALFRRLTRKRSEIVLMREASISWAKHSLQSFFSAGWRWMLLYAGIGILAALSVETVKEVAATLGVTFGLIIITVPFSIDVPFRTYRRWNRNNLNAFPERNLAWSIFGLLGIPLFGIFLSAFVPPAFTNAFARAKKVQEMGAARALKNAAREEKNIQIVGNVLPYTLSVPKTWQSIKRESPYDLTLLKQHLMILVMAEKGRNVSTDQLTIQSLNELQEANRLVSSTDPEEVVIDGRIWNRMLVRLKISDEEVLSVCNVYSGPEGAFQVIGITKEPPFEEHLVELIDVMKTFRFLSTH